VISIATEVVLVIVVVRGRIVSVIVRQVKLLLEL